MQRIKLSTDYGLLVVEYPINDWKRQKLSPLKLNFDGNSKTWTTSASRAREVVEHIKNFGGNMELSADLSRELNLNIHGFSQDEITAEKEKWKDHPSFAEAPTNSFDKEQIHLTETTTPFNYQWAGVERGIELGGRILLADDMGLGKTLQAIALSDFYKERAPILVASPATLLYNWKSEYEKFLADIDPEDIVVLDNGKKKPEQTVAICSYKYITTHMEEIKDFLNAGGIFILDEAHTIKDMETAVGRCAVEIMHYSKYVIAITGTPLLNRVRELWPILHGLDPIYWNDFDAFKERYCEGHLQKIGTHPSGKAKFRYNADGGSNLLELMSIMRERHMIRRLKKDVLTQLPPKIRSTITLNLTQTDKSFEEFIAELREQSRDTLIKNNFDAARSLSEVRGIIGYDPSTSDEDLEKLDGKTRRLKDPIFTLYEDSGLAKVNEVADWFEEMLEANPDEKLILFAQHQSVLDTLEDVFARKFPKKSSIRIDGKVSPKKRKEREQEFQTNPDCGFAFLSIGAGYAGLTLTAARLVGVVQMPWSSRVAVQMEDRAHRITQEEVVHALYFLGNNAFDAFFYNMIERKADTSNTVLDGVRGEDFESNVRSAPDDEVEFSSNDALLTLLEMIAEEIKEEQELAA
ncbi:TPA: DEAD/DEAH box helicase [Vibrio vulnificus]|uniref:DEAD/DEAH box helicase n=1 Tax=Vibrio vulnificus TaxID=672 RepID=A0A8H9N3F8_VIBVL|nr:DEAD/DEAH box helicase [Vibrio vulnificus]HAS8542151.1 DEAD/DEAH box helicase [Vibrio vulnificus]